MKPTTKMIIGVAAAGAVAYFLYTRYSKKYLGKKLLKLNDLEQTPENLEKAMGDLSAGELREESKKWY
jgi:hypothetical protein